MIVSSFFEGRVRFKAALFKNSEISRQITDMLMASKSVENITVNEITGSMLIEYSPSKIPLLKIKKSMPYFEKIKEIYEIYGEEAVPEILSIIKEMDKFFKQ
ncbi:MAG: hypothetical protein ROM03_07040 [Mucispirillum sp.]|nr:hypothetical protein [Mucispirillum sp.]